MPPSLDKALAKIDELLQALADGKLITSCEPPQAIAAAAVPPPPAVTSTAPAGGRQSKKDKKAAVKETLVGDISAKQSQKAAPNADGDAFDKAKLVVARVTSVNDHPSGSDKLWLCKVDVGGGEERQVVAGLKKHVSQEDLTGQLVACVLNLKPAKLAGELSEAMILAADHRTDSVELVRVLSVPDDCQPGDLVFRDGTTPPAQFPKECKSKLWKQIVDGLTVRAGLAEFCGAPLVTKSGRISAGDMPDGASIH